MSSTQQQIKSVFNATPDKWRVCMRDSEGRVECLPMCNSFHAAETLTYSLRCVNPSIHTTLEPCTFLPEFLDIWYAKRDAERVFKRCFPPSRQDEDKNANK